GLQNHQTRMDVIGNNIANVNTVGFKASRVKFQDVFSQTMQGATGASGNLGGTNPVQIGMGVGVASIDTIFTDGSLQTTGKSTDLAITGKGFFVLSNGTDEVYTRAGGFDFDTAGNFIVPGTGYKVQGWTADSTGAINTSSTATDIKIPGGTQMPNKLTTGIDYTNNLSASDAIGTTIVSSTNVYDSLGNPQKVNQTFVKESDNTWLASTGVPGSSITAGGLSRITFTKDGALKDISTITVTPIPTAAVTIPDGSATNPTTLQLNNTLNSVNKSVYTVFDKNNIPHEVQVAFTNTAPNQWSYSVTDLANPNAAELTRGTTTYSGTAPTGGYTNFPISFTLAGTTNPITINAPSAAS
ncbi:flagellar hook-basal body complex protein, partial [Pelosinus sp. sgz500959]|uniref:flagellar hook-basal body complex protein n=1 Tax=Pelosinus sp. sgz500959 TaxID=3242472 RepID=UPI0036702A1B